MWRWSLRRSSIHRSRWPTKILSQRREGRMKHPLTRHGPSPRPEWFRKKTPKQYEHVWTPSQLVNHLSLHQQLQLCLPWITQPPWRFLERMRPIGLNGRGSRFGIWWKSWACWWVIGLALGDGKFLSCFSREQSILSFVINEIGIQMNKFGRLGSWDFDWSSLAYWIPASHLKLCLLTPLSAASSWYWY